MANNGVVTPEFRVSFPNLFEPKKNDLSGKEEFSVVALFAKGADLSKLKAAAEEAIIKKWGKDKAKWPKNIRSPFRDQAERAKDVDGKRVLPAGHEEGAIFLTLKSQGKPGVVGPNVQPILDTTEIYAGCYARALVSVYAYDNLGNRGVSFGLQHVQKMREGEPLGGRVRVEDAFSPVDTGEGASSGGSASDLFG